ncbi:RICIN domain-containing protein [Actinacidiphila epipremni]|uniref:Ricin-type beta-trefoil lectin domain protein n=1 Tax=Actinacidiphila epipremni TaxID=2053013 RepID=A0ABX0ZY21_9ACTN|nr:RICIN domain-containing protein [Actinacidiphila epipremni]NJP46328.1 ricin-type beta-trefoil lectin domain protein [Actinacidiphila epipremni]
MNSADHPPSRHAPRRLGSRRRKAAGIAGGTTAATAAAVCLAFVPAHAAGAASAVGAGTYTLTNTGSSLCLDVPGSSGAVNVQLQQQTCANGSNQRWTLTAVSGGYTLSSVSSGLCVGVQDARTNAGAPIRQETCTGAASQTWTLTADGGSYRVANANGGKCMNIKDNSTSAGALVQTNSCDSVATKRWTLTATGGTGPTSPPTTAPTTAPPTTAPPTTAPPTTGAIYVAPGGTSAAAGTQSDPTTLASAVSRVGPGGTIYLRGGTYAYAQTVVVAQGNNGTAAARTLLSAYPGETPVLDFSAQSEDSANRGLELDGDYWHVYGIVVQHAGDNGIFIGGSHNIVERTVTAYNHDTGLQISRIASTTPQSQWPADNLVLSCESHDNSDSDGEDADGFAAKLTSGAGNVFRYDVSHNNIDDGWDLFTKTETGPIGAVTIEYSLSYRNGTLSNGQQNDAGDRNGFKLGGDKIAVDHAVRHDIAYGNGHDGFTYNSNPGDMTVTNNVSIDNSERNFHWETGASVFRNDTSCRFASGGSNDKVVGDTDSSDQFWSGTNGSQCSAYSGALGWSFASDGKLVVTLGGRTVTP